MNIFRKATLWILPSLFRIALVLLAISTALTLVFGTPEKLKDTLNESGVYSSFVDGVIKENAKNNQDEGSVPLNQPEVQSAIKSSFNPDLLKQSTEKVIDGSYAWLDGKTTEPTFAVDLNNAKQQLANGLGDYAMQRVANLPVCNTPAQLQQFQNGNIDPFTMTCRPPGLNLASEKQKFIREFMGNKEFLSDTNVTAQDLPKTSSGEPIAQAYQNAPETYQWAKRAPLILGALALLMAIGIFFLAETRQKGIRLLGMSFLTTGVFLAIATLIIWFLFKQANEPGGRLAEFATSSIQTTFIGILGSLYEALNRILIIFAGSYVVVGAILLLIQKLRSKSLARGAQSDPLAVAAAAPIAAKQNESNNNNGNQKPKQVTVEKTITKTVEKPAESQGPTTAPLVPEETPEDLEKTEEELAAEQNTENLKQKDEQETGIKPGDTITPTTPKQ
ncbi:MAG: hypothetical protein JWL85_535 [Candidatus Saccharibacteria bacterium]|nr:hypothetical protein [Candidatus Saccharibacteria bacterium]